MNNKIIIINGPNLNLLGEREQSQYGSISIDKLKEKIEQLKLKDKKNKIKEQIKEVKALHKLNPKKAYVNKMIKLKEKLSNM